MTIESDNPSESTSQGKRAIFMLLFWIVSRFTFSLVFFIAVFQLICVFVTSRPNKKVLHFGRSLSYYLAQIVDYLTYNSEEKPWPFQEWPTD